MIVGSLAAFIVAALLPLAVLMGVHAQVGRVQGDLTRLGQLASRDFGRNAPPEAPPLKLLRADTTLPGIIVLGDSFSRWNLWQSHWMSLRGRHDVITFDWDKIGGTACLPEWARQMRARYPSARQLIVEVIERSFATGLKSLEQHCLVRPETTRPVMTGEAILADQSVDTLWPPPDPRYALRAWAAPHKAFATQSRRDQVVVTPLSRSDLFTSRRSELLLSYIEDQDKAHWKAESMHVPIGRLKAMQDELETQGITMIIAVVPDKSTMYAPYFRLAEDRVPAPVDPWQLLQSAGIRQVPLRDRLRLALPGVRDLYLPDDTHFSYEGFRLMAAAIRDEAER